MDHQSRMRSIRDAASLINSGGDMRAVLRHLVMAACRHASWAMGSILGIDEQHGQAFVIVRYDPTMIQPRLPTHWELATSPAIVALRRSESVYIRDARMSEEFPGFRRAAFERDYHTVLVMPMNCVDEEGRPMVLTVTAREVTDVDPDDLAFLGTIVHLGEIAVEKEHRLRQERLAGERPQKALEVHTALLQKALADSSVGGLARMVSELLPNPIVVVDFAANASSPDARRAQDISTTRPGRRQPTVPCIGRSSRPSAARSTSHRPKRIRSSWTTARYGSR